MSWFKKEMKEFWFGCRHPFGIDDVMAPPEFTPSAREVAAIKNLLELSRERLELSSVKKGAKPKVMSVMAPSTRDLALASINVIELYIRRMNLYEEEDIS